MEQYLSPTSPLVLAAAVSISVGASLLGVFMILRRMALVADAFSHVALPGIATGLILGFLPSLGAFAMLVLAVFVITELEHRRSLAPETTLGVIFTASLAVGLLLIPDEELLESLFGDVGSLTATSAALSLVGGIMLAALVILKVRQFALLTLSPELAHASGVSVERSRFLFFVAVAFAVSLGIQFMGVLLVGALIVLPAATAKNISPNLRAMALVAAILAAGASLGGLALSSRLGILPGPTVVVVLVAFFVGSLVFQRRS